MKCSTFIDETNCDARWVLETTRICARAQRAGKYTEHTEKVLRYFPQLGTSLPSQGAKRLSSSAILQIRSSRTPWHFVPHDDGFALLQGQNGSGPSHRRPCTPRKRRALYPTLENVKRLRRRASQGLTRTTRGGGGPLGAMACGPEDSQPPFAKHKEH